MNAIHQDEAHVCRLDRNLRATFSLKQAIQGLAKGKSIF